MNSTTLTVIDTITARSCSQDTLLKYAKELIKPSKAERGCLSYKLFCNEEKSAGLIEVMQFKDDKAFQAHMSSKHVAEFIKHTKRYGVVFNLRKAYEISG